MQSSPTATAAPAPAGASVHGPRTRHGSGRAGRPEPRTYDFRRPTKLSREHVRALQIAFEAFARGVTSSLTGVLGAGIRMELLSVEQFTYGEHVAAVPNPAFICPFTLDPLPGKGSLTLPLDMAMRMVDHLTGGRGTAEQPSRPMTSLEAALAAMLMRRVLTEFAAAMHPLNPLEPELGTFEYNPTLAQVAAASETVIIGRFELRRGSKSATASLCLPFGAFSPVLQSAASPHLTAREQRERAEAAAMMATALEQVPLDVVLRCAPTRMSAGEVVRLGVGDVLPLRHPSDAPLELVASGVTFAHALHGNHRSRLAAQVVPTPST